MESTTTTRQLEVPVLGEPGQPCEECGAPLAADQRYCINCGHRRAGPRVAFEQLIGAGSEPARQAGVPPAVPPRRSSAEWSPMWAAAGLAALGVMLVVGVLLGKGSDTAPVVKVGGVPSTASTASAGGAGGLASNTGSFTSDWPSGKTGYTVELGTLPKSGTTPDAVAAAKSDAGSKGASDVGALDSDQYSSLPPGSYILYSGVYDTKAEASKALAKLKAKFPDAKVVNVSDKAAGSAAGGGGNVKKLTGGGGGDAPIKASKADLQALQGSSGSSYEQQTKKLNQPILTPGQQAKKDSKAPGAGSGAQEFK